MKFGADNGAKKYMNRLADYLYILARYTDAKMEEMSAEEVDKPTEKTSDGGKDEVRTMPENQNQTGAVNEAVIQEVLKRMGIQGRITLASAKRLIEKNRKQNVAVRRLLLQSVDRMEIQSPSM